MYDPFDLDLIPIETLVAEIRDLEHINNLPEYPKLDKEDVMEIVRYRNWIIDGNYDAFALTPGDSLEARVEKLEENNTHTYNSYITSNIRIGGVILDDGSLQKSGDIVITDPGLRVPPGYEDVVIEIYG